ncbi:MAG: hypothetical protein ABSD31_08855 [Candidatus Binataceae bacterium]|jgi:hypothetical protein
MQLKLAIAYAEYAKDEYLLAKRESASIPAYTGTVLIPLGGAALGLGITGNTGVPITALGLTGATAIGVASLLQNKDREDLYVTAAQGVQCLLTNMQPYTNASDDKLKELNGWLDSLQRQRQKLGQLTAAVDNEPKPKKCATPTPEQASRAKLLKAAQQASAAASKADTMGRLFLDTAAGEPSAIVNTVDKINNNLSSALIKTEPDVKSLASNLKGVIPDSATSLAGIPNAKENAAQAKANTPPPSTAAPATAPAPVKTTEVTAGKGASASIPSSISVSAPAGVSTVDGQLAEAVLDSVFVTEHILNMLGQNTSPPNVEACTSLAKKAEEPAVLAFNPDGDILISKGDKTTVAITGAKAPYIRPMFTEPSQPAITATLVQSNIELAATKEAKAGFYPFFVGDGPTGKPLNVAILTSPEDSCPQPTTAVRPGGCPEGPPCPPIKQKRRTAKSASAKPGARKHESNS